jgi:ribosomal protein L19
MNIIEKLESEASDKQIPDFQPGDTIVVEVKVKEGDRERTQAYEGVAIAASIRRSRCARFPTAKVWSACSRPTARRSAASR